MPKATDNSWPPYIFVRDPRPLLFKIVRQFSDPCYYGTDVFALNVETGIGQRKVVTIGPWDEADRGTIKAPHGLDGALEFERLPSRKPDQELTFYVNEFYRRLYTEDPYEIYGEIMYDLRKPGTKAETQIRPTHFVGAMWVMAHHNHH